MNAYEKGEQMMKTMGLYPNEEMAAAMQQSLPAYWNKMVEDVGSIYGRPELNLKMREVATITALIVMGSALPQLKVHIRAGLHVGLTEQEIKEIIMQMVAYCGYPKTINALIVAQEVFMES